MYTMYLKSKLYENIFYAAFWCNYNYSYFYKNLFVTVHLFSNYFKDILKPHD